MSRLTASFLVFLAWGLTTLLAGRLFIPPHTPIYDVIAGGIAWNILAAAVVVFAASRLMRWRDLKLAPPKPLGSVRLAWFPLLFLSLIFALAVAKGLPPPRALLFIFVNTLIVGFSEELMCRGVLFQGLRSRFKLWPSIVLTSALFGAIHVLNVFATGRLFFAAVQAVAATMTGAMLIALLIRTGSLWVPTIVHALWDFASVTLAGQGADMAELDKLPLGIAIGVPLALVTPNFLYALYLLRRTTNATQLANE